MSDTFYLDRPIVGAANIARAANLFTKKGAPDADKIYYKHERGLLDGIVHKNGRELISSLRQIQKLATTTIAVKNE